MLTLPSNQVLYTLGFVICSGLIMVALYFQFVLLLEPCPLCVLQRIGFISIGLVCLLAAFHNPARLGNRVYGALITLGALTGFGIALRHVWLQHNPPLVAECGPGLDVWVQTLSPVEVLQRIFIGTGDCTEVMWRFAGLSIPAWAAVMFLGFTLFGVRQLFFRRPVRN